MASQPVDIGDLVDRQPISPYQRRVFLLIGACLVIDGFDVQAIGYVAPAIIAEWGIPSAAMGPVFSAGLFGLFLGSLAFSMLADRAGRRPVMIGAVVFFALCTLLAARAGSLTELLALRFLAGCGLGAILPNATALVGEYAPRRSRVFVTMVVTNGFTVGAMIGGFLAAWLIPAYGWRSVFVVGGIAPLVLLGPMVLWLPESLRWLVLRGGAHPRITRWLGRIAPAAAIAPDARFVTAERPRHGLPLAQVFGDGRAAGTTLLWVVNFANVLNAYFVASWLPSVLRDAGHTTSTAVLVGTAVQAGGAIGTVVLGWTAQRVGFVPVLAACFALAAANLAVLGQPQLSVPLLFTVAFLTGVGIFGGQPAVNTLAAEYYPTGIRSTGIGAGLGIGRLGAILGPLLAAELIARRWSPGDIFGAAVVPALVALAAILAMGFVLRRRPAASASGS